MKVYNTSYNYEMCKELKKKLADFRKKRGFYAKAYIDHKAVKLNEYMEVSGLDTCIVAVSGGIDSAVVLGLVSKAFEMESSPIKRIIPVLLPCYKNAGVTNQEDATKRGREVCSALGLSATEINMHYIANSIQHEVEGSTPLRPDEWATGQLVSYARTSVLYYLTSLCRVEGYHAIIVGTTNFSEGGYLGYVGKASDGMVDVQLISDIYKSEVYAVAKELNLPDSVIDVTPAGDMYDYGVDEEVFGASYDFVELYQEFLRVERGYARHWYNSLPEYAKEQFDELGDNLEHLHKYNAHKYLCGSPAVHLDLWKSNVRGGWQNRRWKNENLCN